MKTSVVGKILMALVFASVIGGISAGSALSGDSLSPLRGIASQQRGGHVDRDRHVDRGRKVYRPYRYQRDPIYAPPPVIYAPEPSPGISIFFPPIVIR